MATVSIIITSFNSAAFIERALSSALGQQLPHGSRLEVVVVDDASSDSTPDIARRFAGKPHISLILLTENKGVSHARNAGLKKITGDYVRFLDADDEILPKTSLRQLEILGADREADAVFCDCAVEYQGEKQRLWSEQYPFSGDKDALEQFIEGNRICLHTALIKTAVATKLGFDETLRNAEDHDFWLRFLAGGGNLRYEPFVGAVYHRQKDGLSKPGRRVFENNKQVLQNILSGGRHSELIKGKIAEVDGILAGFYLEEGDYESAGRSFSAASRAGRLSGYKKMLFVVFKRNAGMARYLHRCLRKLAGKA